MRRNAFTIIEIIICLVIISIIVKISLTNISVDAEAEIKRFSGKVAHLIDYGVGASLFKEDVYIEINKDKKYIKIREEDNNISSFQHCLKLKKHWRIISVCSEIGNIEKNIVFVKIEEGEIEEPVIMTVDTVEGVYMFKLSNEYDFQKAL